MKRFARQSRLSAQHMAMLRFIAGYQAAHGGISPSYIECALAIGAHSKSHASRVLDRLECAGQIRRIPNRARAIEVLAPVSIPSIDNAPLYAVPQGTWGRGFSGERL